MPGTGESADQVMRSAQAVAGPLSSHERQVPLQHQLQWQANHLRTEPMDDLAAASAISMLYRVAGLSRPRIVLVSSPSAVALAATLATYIGKCRRSAPDFRPHAKTVVPLVQDCRHGDLRRGVAAAVLAAVATDSSSSWPDLSACEDVRHLTLSASCVPADVDAASAMDREWLWAVQSVEADLHDLR